MCRDTWQLTESLSLGLHPRTFDELHAERVGLLNTLQSHNQQAVDLFRKLPALEEKINRLQHAHRYSHPPSYRRGNPEQGTNSNAKIKVKVNGIPVPHADPARDGGREAKQELHQAFHQRLWLHKQVEDIVKAERALLARLGDIQVEIQCRERWCQIEHERATGLGPHYPTLPVLESWGLGLVQPMGHMAPTGPHGFVSGPLLSPLRLDGLPQQGDDGLVRNPLEFAPPTTGSCAPPEHEKYDQNRVRTMACDDRPGDIKLVGEKRSGP